MVATGLGDGEAAGPGSPVPTVQQLLMHSVQPRGAGGTRRGSVSLEAAGLLVHRPLPQLLARLGGRRGGRGGRGFGQMQDRVLPGLHPQVGLDLVVPGLAVAEIDDPALVGAFVCGLHPGQAQLVGDVTAHHFDHLGATERP